MSVNQQLHSSLLRIPVMHILRAAGFHSTKPSVLDTLVNITERYLILLATTTLNHALDNHNTPTPTITDARLALTECGTLIPVMSAAEEDWTEKFRHSMTDYDNMPHGDIRRQGEINKRAEEDTRDVREFIQWIMGDVNKEIRRIAGVLPEVGPGGTVAGEDYLTAMKKKHAKTGEESRFQGTVLGIPAEDRPVKIEGGPVESLYEWQMRTIEQVGRGDGVVDAAAKQDVAHEEEVAEQQLQIAMDVS